MVIFFETGCSSFMMLWLCHSLVRLYHCEALQNFIFKMRSSSYSGDKIIIIKFAVINRTETQTIKLILHYV